MNISMKTLIKNAFFGSIVWILGMFVASLFGAAFATASGVGWLMNVFMMVYLIGSLVFFGWLIKNAVTRADNGKHSKEGHRNDDSQTAHDRVPGV